MPSYLRASSAPPVSCLNVSPSQRLYSGVFLPHMNFYFLRFASDPWKPWKIPVMVDTSEKVPEIPWKLGWSLEKYLKKPAKISVWVRNGFLVAISSILVPKFSPAVGNYHCILLHSLIFSILPCLCSSRL